MQHSPGDIPDPWPVPYIGVDGECVQNCVDCLSLVLRWYLACCRVDPMHEAAVGAIPCAMLLNVAVDGIILS